MSTENNNALLIETPSTTLNTTSQKTDNSNLGDFICFI